MTNLAPAEAVRLRATYVDSSGNETSAPAGAGPLVWTASDPSVASLDTVDGANVTLTAVGAINATETLTVSDGVFTSAADTVTITAGPAVGINIVPA